MALTKASDLRTKSKDELKDRLTELRKEQFNLRFQRSTGQLANGARPGQVRREIAQVMTILNAKTETAAPKKARKAKAA
jgi:large subunit ribosomal protein L29